MTTTCKLGEKGCWNDGKCRATSNCVNKIVTNADRIRAMNDEELSEYIAEIIDDANSGSVIYSNKKEEWLEWLKQPAEE